MDINCTHFNSCSGCNRNRDVNKPHVYQNAKKFFNNLGIQPFHLNVGAIKGWRTRAKLAVRGTTGKPLIGLFEEGTHQVVEIPFCQVHHPAINKAVEKIKIWMINEQIAPYDERIGKGCLRYIQLVVECSTNKVQLVLVLNEPLKNNSLKTLFSEEWQSIWVNNNTRRDNVIFGSDWQRIIGEEWLWETIAGCKICFHPASFAQANLEMFDRLIEHIKPFIPKEADVVEYYAGVGAIGLSIVSDCRRVRCVEIVPLAKQCFDESFKKLSPDLQERITYISGPSESHTELIQEESQVVIVDPPRKGLDSVLLKALCNAQRKTKLIYISCGWNSFQKDCKILLDHGWKLHHAEGFLFFPGSDHLETLAIFDLKAEG